MKQLVLTATLAACLALLSGSTWADEEKLTYFDDGSVASRAQMHEGKANGLHLDYYPGGAVHSSMTLVDDKPVGEARELYPDGQLKSRLQHDDNGVLRSVEKFTQQGVQVLERRWDSKMREQGTSRSWHANGKPEQAVEFVDGRRDGWSRRWREDGSLESACRYADDRLQAQPQAGCKAEP